MDEECPSSTLGDMQSFADALRKRAEQLGLSNAEIARRANLTERRYGNYVTGVREPDLATLARIARALGVTPDALLGFDGGGARSGTERLIERLVVSASTLPKGDLELLIVQVEAVAAHRGKATQEGAPMKKGRG